MADLAETLRIIFTRSCCPPSPTARGNLGNR